MALYVRYVVRKLFNSDCDVAILLTPSALAHPGYELVKAEVGGELETYLLPELPERETSSSTEIFVDQIKAWFALRREFARIVDQCQPNIVYMPTMDWVGKAIELLGSPFRNVPFVALYMAPKHHRKEMGLGPSSRHDWFYSRLFQRLLKIPTLCTLLVIDEFFYEYCCNKYPVQVEKVRYVPDFGVITGEGTKAECREMLGIRDSARVMLVYGALTRRKGIAKLLEAFSDNTVPSDLVLLFAGKPDQAIRNILQTTDVVRLIKCGKIISRPYFHADVDEYIVFRASDYVWLGYIDGFYGSSGVLFQSVAADLPVIAMKDGLIGSLVSKYSLGVLIDPYDAKSVLSGFLAIEDFSSLQRMHSEERNYFLNTHCPEKHSSGVLKAIKFAFDR